MRVVALLLAAALSAGCVGDVAERVGGLRGGGAPPEPYYASYDERVQAHHNQSYPFPVEPGAVALQVDLRLTTRGGGALPASPALLTLTLLSPAGDVLAERTADARNPAQSIGLTEIGGAGEYVARVTGSGLATDALAGADAGAAYTVAIEVVYA